MVMMTDPLVTLLSNDACQPLLRRLIEKLARGQFLTGRCRLQGLTVTQQSDIVALIGGKCRAGGVTVDLAAFDRIVRDTGRFDSLESLVRACAGEPIVNRQLARQIAQRAWDDALGQVRTRTSNDERVVHCIEQLRATGWLARLTERDPRLAKRMLHQALDMLDALPMSPLPLAVFAAAQLGDAHGLDATQPQARLLLRLLAAKCDVAVPVSASDRRQLFEQANLVVDELSSTVLALNLPAMGDGLTDRMLRDHAAQGFPCRLSFRHLRLQPPIFASAANAPLFVCENPSVIVAAADEFGAHCPPLVCVEGNPAVAGGMLLALLVQSGYIIQYHGDFDWGGLRIANRIFARFGFVPWRFSACDYHLSDDARPLKPPPTDALWDSDLRPVMERGGRSIDEEAVLELLLNDLRTAKSSG